MAPFKHDDQHPGLAKIRGPLRLTWAGMWAESLVRALWPVLTVVLLVLAALMLGLQDVVSLDVVYGAAAVVFAASVAALIYAFRSFYMPTRAEALARLDASLPGRPIQALMDDQAIGAGDAASMAVWQAHQKRMADRAATARAVPADLRVSRRDPYALRYVALLLFAVALVFGSVLRVGSVAGMVPGGGGLASGPVWEGWAEPPRYTGKPTLYLADLEEGPLSLPKGTLITVRLYGEVGALEVVETVSGQGQSADADPALVLDFKVNQSGGISIDGPGGRSWDVAMLPDAVPKVEIAGEPQVAALGEMSLPFAASDDYGVEAGEARISLDLALVDRRYGLGIEPDARPDLSVPLPMPIAGGRTSFEENLIEDFSKHPWANLPVKISLSVLDASEQQFTTAPSDMILPGRRFFDPLAAAVIEQRRDLLWSKANAPRLVQLLKAVSYRPQDVFRTETSALRLRRQIDRLDIRAKYGLTDDLQAEIADDLWDLAIELEEGVLADALERMRRAQERLAEAMKNGASKEEIAELMDELRRATEEYMQQLQRQQAEDGEQQQGQQGETMQMTQDDLQRMMDRIQELMEQGRMAEAEQALRELQEMMENMRVTEGQPGQGGDSPGEQAMEGLADTLREQQELSDQAFRDLQDQFNRNESPDQPGQQEGQQPQQGQQPGEGQEPGQGQDSIAERQQELRNELNRQEGRLPGKGSAEGEAARDALDRAGRAMDDAEQALRQNELADAIDDQARAMEALRDGMRALGDAIAQEQQQQAGQGSAEGNQRAEQRDPLGRDQSSNGGESTQGDLALDNDAYGRARELLDEIRRRSGETARPEVERDYLNRLLDRF
ncbi:TIGR02302 family protein [Sulfitobacter sp. CW3]|uniref:TIGR02302 family protein n=1 Tax=Sulfitobacter sp. CW3 TaxID=2861965 RepID=UPI001C5E22C3|nr:TIGR02302 family protein [Sulfitobacter sp. CW3]MBW4961300.1 TIGR02302 family protein [Sulfitobacter sp. CW3]